MWHETNNANRHRPSRRTGTKEQLGYVVFCGAAKLGGYVDAVRFVVMGDAQHPAHVERRVEAFLARLRGKIAAMSAVPTQRLNRSYRIENST